MITGRPSAASAIAAEVGDDARPRRLVVVRRDGQEGVDAGLERRARERDRVVRVVGAGVGDDACRRRPPPRRSRPSGRASRGRRPSGLRRSCRRRRSRRSRVSTRWCASRRAEGKLTEPSGLKRRHHRGQEFAERRSHAGSLPEAVRRLLCRERELPADRRSRPARDAVRRGRSGRPRRAPGAGGARARRRRRRVVALATTGEPTSLDDAERAAVVSACAEACAAATAVLVVGAGTNDTRTTIARHEALADVPGVAASLAVVPYYVRPSEAAIVRHFQAVAERSPVPLIVYNIPYRTGRGLGAAALIELAATDEHRRREAGRRRHRRRHAARACRGARPVRGAGRRRRVPASRSSLMGAPARSPPRRTCAPARSATWSRAASRGDVAGGRPLAEALLPLVQALFAEPSPAVIKAVLHAARAHPDGRRAHAALPRVARGGGARRSRCCGRPTSPDDASSRAEVAGSRRAGRRCRRPRCGGSPGRRAGSSGRRARRSTGSARPSRRIAIISRSFSASSAAVVEPGGGRARSGSRRSRA